MVKQNLVSFHIIERESSQQNLVTWTYPTLTDELTAYLKARCFPPESDKDLFFYLRKNNLWMYIQNYFHKQKLTALIVVAEEFIPDKYKLLCDILEKKYTKTSSPVELVKLYINLISGKSIYYQENGSEIGLDLKARSTEVGIKDLISNFGLEIILIYNAILLKRRILIYHHDIEKLQKKMAPMTYLIPFRNLKDYLLPWIENINELKGCSFYLAGTTEKNALSNERYYDLYVNLLENEITISKAAKDCFTMAKIHKDIALFLVQLSESDLSEIKVIEQIQNKTKDVVQQLYSIAVSRDNKKMVTMNDLKSKKYSPPLENFLFNMAVAENIMIL
ncbi:protein FAM45A [Anoplophora glabripennis]|uniref:protein FAM45A n=1 Tax=Anoplophora glabripennis TaxID=217634 RepID=UPI000874CBD4|nr:protein FAM45A [Anoplophora glabripennis]